MAISYNPHRGCKGEIPCLRQVRDSNRLQKSGCVVLHQPQQLPFRRLREQIPASPVPNQPGACFLSWCQPRLNFYDPKTGQKLDLRQQLQAVAQGSDPRESVGGRQQPVSWRRVARRVSQGACLFAGAGRQITPEQGRAHQVREHLCYEKRSGQKNSCELLECVASGLG